MPGKDGELTGLGVRLAVIIEHQLHGFPRHKVVDHLKACIRREPAASERSERIGGGNGNEQCGEQTDFAGMDAPRAETERLFEAFRHGHFIGRVHGHDVFSRALDFPPIFNDDMTFIGELPYHFGDEGIGEGGFPRSGPTDHTDVSISLRVKAREAGFLIEGRAGYNRRQCPGKLEMMLHHSL